MLGTHCIGAKVNHVLKPLMYKLEGGDQVEIITSNTQQVKQEWLEYVTTAKAKSKIQACLRKMNRELQHEGNKKLQVFLEHRDLEFNSTTTEKLRRFHHFHTREELLMAIGSNTLILGDADVNYLKGKHEPKWKKFLPFTSSKEEIFETEPNIEFINSLDHKKVFVLNDHNIRQCTIASCCSPIPGDDVLGYIDDRSNTLIIHKRNCETATKLKSKFGNNIIATRWDIHETLFKARICINGIDEEGILLRIADILYHQQHTNVTALNIEGKNGVFEAELTVMVHNVDEVTAICQSLKQIKEIVKIYRQD